jgi:hypothetical protein
LQKSYLAKTTINFLDYAFYVRPGDLLVHDTANHNRLTIYRNGQIAKVVQQDSIGILAFLKNEFIKEVNPVTASPAAVPAPEKEETGYGYRRRNKRLDTPEKDTTADEVSSL